MATGPGLFKLWRLGVVHLLAWLLLVPGGVRGQAPDEDWRTLTTDRFRVTFPAHLEDLGRRAAGHAELAYDELARDLPRPGGSRIDLLLTDHSDLSNGFAQVKPSKRITIFAAPPTDGLQLSFYDDWLELVITHELAHVMHLDHTDMILGRLGRAVFGRAPADWPLFPGVATPDWVIEGLATWYESRLTHAGRVKGTFHEMQVRTAVLEGRFEGIGAASGRSPLWPGGNRSYLYGSLFFDHLLERYGEDRMSAFVEAVAGQWVPYRIDAAARASFGVSFSDAWGEWEEGLKRRYERLDVELARLGPVTDPERLTVGARWALYPRVSPDGSTLVHTWADGRTDTQLRRARPDGAGSSRLSRTNGLSSFAWTPDGLLLISQLENADPYSAYGDLYLLDPEGGTRRLTEGARLEHPSVEPGGSWAVAVQRTGGTNRLVRVDLAGGALETLVEERHDVHWAFPRVSPDGRWIAATRWRSGAYHDVVVLPADGGAEPVEVTRDRALDLAPDWSPDGRWLVWSSDRTGISNAVAASFDASAGTVGPVRLLTNVRTGALYPSVDPTGTWLYFSGYHVDGWEVERTPFAPEDAPLAPAPLPRFEAPVASRPDPSAEGPVQGYSALPTLLPRYWEPLYREPVVAPAFEGSGTSFRRRELLGFGLGAETGSVDLVGRHEYSAYVHVFTSGGKAEGGLTYAFRGFGNPVFALNAGQSYASAGRILSGPAAAPDTSYVLQRERGLGASMTVLSTRWRRDLALTLGGGLAWTAYEQLDNDLQRVPLDPGVPAAPTFADLSASLSFSTARSHSFQTGGARGLSVFLQARRRLELDVPAPERGVPELDASVDELFARVRGYVPLWQAGHARHVLAVQLTAAGAYGPQATFGRFGVGGASGREEELTGFTLFGGRPIPLPVRGYEVATRFGRWAWAASGEYRFPLALVNRGLGAWPLHLDRIVGTLFADVGDAGMGDTFADFLSDGGDPLASVGAEVMAHFLGRWDAPLLLRTGVAFPLVGEDGASVYVRVGVPF